MHGCVRACARACVSACVCVCTCVCMCAGAGARLRIPVRLCVCAHGHAHAVCRVPVCGVRVRAWEQNDDPIIGASSCDPFDDDRSACDGTAAAERGGPQAFHEGLPIQSSKTQRQPHRRAPKLVAWMPAEPFGRSAAHAYVSDSESLALIAGEDVYVAWNGAINGHASGTTRHTIRTRARATGCATLVPTRPHIPPHSSRMQHSERVPPPAPPALGNLPAFSRRGIRARTWATRCCRCPAMGRRSRWHDTLHSGLLIALHAGGTRSRMQMESLLDCRRSVKNGSRRAHRDKCACTSPVRAARALRSGGSRSASLLFPPATDRDRAVTGSPLDRESTQPASVCFQV
jgi:hypothetical protein